MELARRSILPPSRPSSAIHASDIRDKGLGLAGQILGGVSVESHTRGASGRMQGGVVRDETSVSLVILIPSQSGRWTSSLPKTSGEKPEDTGGNG